MKRTRSRAVRIGPESGHGKGGIGELRLRLDSAGRGCLVGGWECTRSSIPRKLPLRCCPTPSPWPLPVSLVARLLAPLASLPPHRSPSSPSSFLPRPTERRLAISSLARARASSTHPTQRQADRERAGRATPFLGDTKPCAFLPLPLLLCFRPR